MRRIEIQPVGPTMATIETFVGIERTSMSRPLLLEAARTEAVAMSNGDLVVDHTLNMPDSLWSRQVAQDRFNSGEFRP